MAADLAPATAARRLTAWRVAVPAAPCESAESVEHVESVKRVEPLAASPTGWALCLVAALVLALGTAVYLTDRNPAQAQWIPAVPALAGRQLFGVGGQWLPSFVHPFAFALVSAAALPHTARHAAAACLAWAGINLLAELGQHAVFKPLWADLLHGGSATAAPLQWLARYELHGRFDPGDLVAIVLGAASAALLLRVLFLPAGDRHGT
jgi:hypothetical protein